jgi:hypothetical protein
MDHDWGVLSRHLPNDGREAIDVVSVDNIRGDLPEDLLQRPDYRRVPEID